MITHSSEYPLRPIHVVSWFGTGARLSDKETLYTLCVFFLYMRAIVIGASSGIGREVAKLLIQEGWTLGVAARRVEMLQDIGNVEVEQIDVTTEDAPARLRSLIEKLGGMDLFFYASGIGKQNRELQQDIEMATMQTNALGFTRMIGEAYRYFAEQGAGHIAAITSIAGTKGLGPAPAYSAIIFCNTGISDSIF